MRKINIVLSLILVLFIAVGSVVFFVVLYPLKYKSYIVKYCNQFDLDVVIVSALINVESSYKPKVISSAGARGLMQLMPSTATEVATKLNESFKTEDLFDVDTNIRYGCYYLSYLMDMYNDIDLAIYAYNAGYNKVNDWLSNPNYSDDGKTLHTVPYNETKNYLRKIKRDAKVYRIYY